MANLNDIDYGRSKELKPQDITLGRRRRERVAPFVTERELPDNDAERAEAARVSDDDQDMAVAGGISLAQGSAEYREYQMDRADIPQAEHDRLAREMQERGERVGQMDEREMDKWHDGYNKGIVRERNESLEEHQAGMTPRQRRIKAGQHLEKIAIAEEMQGFGRRATATRSKADDEEYRRLVHDVDDLGVDEVRKEANKFEKDVEADMAGRDDIEMDMDR